jgi:cobalamin-dependent methionine synthase I
VTRTPNCTGSRFRGNARPRYLCLADFFRDRELALAKGPTWSRSTGHHGFGGGQGDRRAVRAQRVPGLSGTARLSVQLTEALAEMWHARVRSDLGFARDDGEMDDMIRDQAYRGSRYSFGYPACPDLDDRVKLVGPAPPERIGVELSEELQLTPRAVHRRLDRPPPRSEVLQRPLDTRPEPVHSCPELVEGPRVCPSTSVTRIRVLSLSKTDILSFDRLRARYTRP